MKKLTTCPSPEQLEQLLLSSASEEAYESLAAHLDTCDACRKRADSIGQQASLESDLHWATEVRARTVVDVEEPLRRLSEILSEYEIVSEVGRGGMGIVYKANQSKLNRQVAIKVLPALLGVVQPEAKARFRREAELAAGLDHTNIISIYDYGEANGTLYYTMQLIKGRSLRDILREIEETGAVDCVVGEDASDQNGTRMSRASEPGRRYYECVAGWIAEVAEALQYAHEHGVIHRDIKPSNLLLAQDGRLMISDFGLARAAESQSITTTRSLLGTCRYMAPELLGSDDPEPDALIDVYALGATMYELLAFRPMFGAPDDRQVMHQIQNHDPLPPHRVVRSVPRELETICLKAVAKDRRVRYQSAGELADDLHRWQLDMPIRARRQSVGERAVRFAKRRKLTVALSAIALLLAATAGGLAVKAARASHDAETARTSEAAQRARGLDLQAVALMEAEQFQNALKKLDEAIVLDPTYAPALHRKSTALRRLGKPDEANALLESAIESDPDDWRAHFLLGMAIHPGHGHYPGGGVFPHNDVHNDENVRRSAQLGTHIAHVQRLRPNSPELLCLKSCAEPDHRQAVALLDRAIELDPTMTDAIVERAVRLGYYSEHDAVLDSLDEAQRRGHTGSHIHGLRGITLYQLGRNGEAEAAFADAIERAPKNVHWWYDRAVVRTYMSDWAGAIEDSDVAIEIDPEYAFAYVTRALGHIGLADGDAALADLNKANELDPTNPDVYSERGHLFWLARRYDESLADANALIALEPDELRGYQRRAQTYLKLERWDDALADLDRCDEIDSDEESTHRIRGGVYFYAGRYDDAADSFADAQPYKPSYYGNYEYRALSLIRSGRYHEALAVITSWMSLADNADFAQMRRGMVYETMGQTDLALADYRDAQRFDRLGDYPEIWAAITAALGGDETALIELYESRPSLDPAASWTDSVIAVLAGRMAPEDALSSVRTPSREIEWSYYAGVRRLLDGDRAGALELFDRAAAIDIETIHETDMARVRAAAIRGAGR